MLPDAQIAAMSPAQRRDLIQRLERPLDEVFPPAIARPMRRRTRLTLMTVGTIALIPWVIYLAFSLPDNYVAHNWPATWIGFDCVLITFMIELPRYWAGCAESWPCRIYHRGDPLMPG